MIGDTVTYRTFGGEIRQCVVDEKSDDIKHGYPGFGGKVIRPGIHDGEFCWGYDDQIMVS